HVVDVLDPKRYEVRAVLVSKEGRWRTTSKPVAPKNGRGFDPQSPDLSWREHEGPWAAIAELSAWRADVVLPVLHGRFGEDGTLQACLQAAGLRFAGSGVLGSAVAADKIRTKEVLGFHGVRTPRFAALQPEDLARGRPAVAEELVRRP